MKGQIPFEFCLKILHFFFFGCVFDHPKKLCFKIWKSSIKICRFCTDFDDDFDDDDVDLEEEADDDETEEIYGEDEED